MNFWYPNKIVIPTHHSKSLHQSIYFMSLDIQGAHFPNLQVYEHWFSTFGTRMHDLNNLLAKDKLQPTTLVMQFVQLLKHNMLKTLYSQIWFYEKQEEDLLNFSLWVILPHIHKVHTPFNNKSRFLRVIFCLSRVIIFSHAVSAFVFDFTLSTSFCLLHTIAFHK